jgi:hypothetical protein
MTEAGWLAATYPGPILEFLHARGGAGNRKLRLFACGCCRQVWSFLTHIDSRAAVEAAEGFADGLVSRRQLEKAAAGARGAIPSAPARLAQRAARVRLGSLAAETTSSVGPGLSARLLRDLFGNPFRPAPSLAPAVLSWNGGTVPRLASAIYEERAFDRLPVLADALEDAGCADADVLTHCRSSGEHTRRCWVVDLVLGKG